MSLQYLDGILLCLVQPPLLPPPLKIVYTGQCVLSNASKTPLVGAFDKSISKEIKLNETSCCWGRARQRCWPQRRSCRRCSRPRRCTHPGRTPLLPNRKLIKLPVQSIITLSQDSWQEEANPRHVTCILRCWPPLETVTLLEPVTNLMLKTKLN